MRDSVVGGFLNGPSSVLLVVVMDLRANYVTVLPQHPREMNCARQSGIWPVLKIPGLFGQLATGLK